MAELLYMQISDDITQQIKSGTLKVNDKLSERRLAEQYNVSRAVVRDALKLLNEKGLVSTQTGRGSFVNIPNGQDLMGRFEKAIDNSCITAETAIEAREVIEMSYIQLISDRATKDNIAKLREISNGMKKSIDDGTEFARLDESFHLVLSSCTQNEVLTLFTGTLNSITNRDRLFVTKAVRFNALKEHNFIIDAVEAHDGEKLREALSRHLNCVREHVTTVKMN